MTPEEEEEVSECTCASAGDAMVPLGHYADCPTGIAEEAANAAEAALNDRWAKAMGDDEPPPPQPERRPPYAVAYSVGGHLYELHVPGDAAVKAEDGALIIQHHLGPVVGIVQVLPVINKERHGAEADQ
ncbi:hypothetical protein [Streptomyces sp. NPDC010273]|uniref:hypothetical protein n=1 Tax=Streptomyces sp. NPDC010273 TaxID=3364829 RepID=UPI0036EDE394